MSPRYQPEGRSQAIVFSCYMLGERLTDDWLSIAETIEFLPVEE